MSKQLEQYVKSSIPEPYTILGCRLHPLSIGHLILMKRFNCLFGEDTQKRDATIWDLLIAVAICCRRYQEFIEWVNNEEERDQWLAEWLTAINEEAKSNPDWALMNRFSLFNMYRQEGISIPYYFEGDVTTDDEKPSGAHWIQSVMSVMTTEGRYTEQELLDMPLSKVLADYFKVLENHGQIQLMSDWEIEAIEKQKQEVTNGQS